MREPRGAGHGLHKSGLVKQRFGVNRFQVMFVTTGSQQHRASMVAEATEYVGSIRDKVPESLYFFSTLDEVEAVGAREKIWVTFEGRFRKMVGG